MAGSLVKGQIGKEDLSFKESGATEQTFERLSSTGSTVELSKLDAGHLQFRSIVKQLEDLIDGGYDITLKLTDIITKSPWVDVRAFGAKGDGSTNDLDAIQDAIDSLPNGGIVFFPIGTYLTSTANSINISDGIILQGAGIDATVIKNTSATRLKGVLSGSDTTNGNHDITIKNMTIERTVLTGSSGNNFNEFIYIGSSAGTDTYNINIERVKFYSDAVEDAAGSKALHIQGGQDIWVTDCIFDADVDSHVSINRAGLTDAYATIKGNKFKTWGTTNAGSCLVITSDYVDVVDNQAEGASANSGFIEFGDDAKFLKFEGNIYKGLGSFITALSGTDFQILDNIMDYTGTAVKGIYLNATGTIVRGLIRGNYFYKGQLLNLNAVDGGTITDITLSDNKSFYAQQNPAIDITEAVGGTMKRVTIENNTIGFADNIGIRANGIIENLEISSNKIYNNGQDGTADEDAGIYIGGSLDNVTLKDNKCFDDQVVATQQHGIEFTGTQSGIILEGNRLFNNGTSQLQDAGTTTYSSKRNNAYTETGILNGRATLVAGTVTVDTTEAIASDNIHLTRVVTGGTVGHLTVGAIVAGTSFVIDSSSNTDTSTIFWEIVH